MEVGLIMKEFFIT